MDLNSLISSIKSHSDSEKIGMILTHTGVVRGVSRDGRKVSGIDIFVDRSRLEQIIETQKKRHPGIVEILVEITDRKHLAVGEEIMIIVAAGDIRENVLAAMSDTIDAIKQFVTQKTEHYA